MFSMPTAQTDREFSPLALCPLFLWLTYPQGYRKLIKNPLKMACRMYRWLEWGGTKKLRQNNSPTLLTFSGNIKPEYKNHSTLTLNQKTVIRTSLVAQWLRICLPMQGTRVRALLWEDSTCRRATKPVRHNYWACTLEPTSHNYWARAPRARAPQQEKPPQWEAHAPQRRVAPIRRN